MVEWLVENGYSKSMGARPMARLIQEKLKKPLAEDILFGKLSNSGGDAYLTEKDGKISFRIEAGKKDSKEALTSKEQLT